MIDGAYGGVLAVGAAPQVSGRGRDGRGDLQHGADRPNDGHLAHSRATIKANTRSASPRPRATASSGPARSPTELESRIWKLRGTEHVFTTIGQTEGGRVVKGEGDVTRGTIYVRITDLEKRHSAVPLKGWWDVAGQVRRFLARAPFDQFEIQQEARKFLEDYPDLRVSVNDVSPFQGGRRPQTFQVSLAGPDLNQLAAYGDQLIAELKTGRVGSSTSTRRSRCANPRSRS